MVAKLIENWEMFVALLVSISAFIAVFLDEPTEESHLIYKIIHKLINYFAFNVGKATNASSQQFTNDNKAE